ncbi:MAG: hypothetical protein HY332_18560 [Chloroflexi bacterium]|nr:hypothetical protein [Chloroflexota bacterium]
MKGSLARRFVAVARAATLFAAVAGWLIPAGSAEGASLRDTPPAPFAAAPAAAPAASSAVQITLSPQPAKVTLRGGESVVITATVLGDGARRRQRSGIRPRPETGQLDGDQHQRRRR